METLSETITSTALIHSGRVFDLHRHTVTLPNGSESVRDIITHPGAVAVLPIHDDGSVTLIRQFRLATGKVLLEACAGGLGKGELPLDCAKRELAEEVRLAAEDWTEVYAVYVAPGYSSEKIWGYLARGLSDAELPRDEDEFMEIIRVPLEQARAWCLDGTIEDAKTMCLVMAAGAV